MRALILAKTRSLLADCDGAARAALLRAAQQARLLTGPSHATPDLPSGSVSLVVTSPPFLDVVNYAADNWLRCWFCGIDVDAGADFDAPEGRRAGSGRCRRSFSELRRVLRPGGHVAFEVGEVRRGTIKLEEAVLPCGVGAGFEPADAS